MAKSFKMFTFPLTLFLFFIFFLGYWIFTDHFNKFVSAFILQVAVLTAASNTAAKIQADFIIIRFYNIFLFDSENSL